VLIHGDKGAIYDENVWLASDPEMPWFSSSPNSHLSPPNIWFQFEGNMHRFSFSTLFKLARSDMSDLFANGSKPVVVSLKCGVELEINLDLCFCTRFPLSSCHHPFPSLKISFCFMCISLFLYSFVIVLF
jgi:hypothetical protein